ncbi:transcription initiation factor TFIIH subunit 2 [Acrasis kona]|uniref:General transcription factor IIH subunit n=1 Tax=Acrasis kona TaxID=1008807 RepID=A0AAW2ZF70_9EUKA
MDIDAEDDNEIPDHVHGASGDTGYVWEGQFTGAWSMLDDNQEGQIINDLQLKEQVRKRQRLTSMTTVTDSIVRKGIIRFMYLILDLSAGVLQPVAHDLKQSRVSVMHEATSDFVKEFFDQNPLSQMGLIVTRRGLAEKILELTGGQKSMLTELKEIFDPSPRADDEPTPDPFGGDPSIQNSLLIAHSALQSIPQYGSREIVIAYSSLSTCDPGDVMTTIQLMKDSSVRCSVVALDAEMYVCKKLSHDTNGTYGVALHQESFKELLLAHALPPPTTTKQKNMKPALIRMGFPQRRSDNLFSICNCHSEIKAGGYICPRCKCKYCDLPTECTVCNLTLVSSPHLARSYHHLFPVAPFVEIDAPKGVDARTAGQRFDGTMSVGTDVNRIIELCGNMSKDNTLCCFGCLKHIPRENSLRLLCTRCEKVFCVECDGFIHQSLHNCPGCE